MCRGLSFGVLQQRPDVLRDIREGFSAHALAVKQDITRHFAVVGFGDEAVNTTHQGGLAAALEPAAAALPRGAAPG